MRPGRDSSAIYLGVEVYGLAGAVGVERGLLMDMQLSTALLENILAIGAESLKTPLIR